MHCKIFTLACTLALLCGPAQGADWGDLKGRFVFDGTAPKAAAVSVTKDVEFCGKHNLVDESLTVGSGGGVANVVVYLFIDRGKKAPAPHPDYAASAASTVEIDNQKCRFEPRVVLLRTSQTLEIKNTDPVGHNTKVDTFANSPINPIIPAGASLKQKFSAEERIPARASCSIHPWMTAWLVIKESPYMAVSDADGNFEIKNLPVGDLSFQAWQEKAGYVSEVTQGGKPTKWSKGRFDVKIKAGVNDLGEIKLPAAIFK